MIATYIVIFAIGVFIGCVIACTGLKPKHFGTLKLFKTSPDEEYQLFAELNAPADNISNEKYVVFKVEVLKDRIR